MSEQAGAAGAIVDEALDAGLDVFHGRTVHARMLRLELLNVMADLERSLGLRHRSSCSPVWLKPPANSDIETAPVDVVTVPNGDFETGTSPTGP